MANKPAFADHSRTTAKPDNTTIIHDLTRAKCEVQLRTIMTAMGLPDLGVR